MARTITLTKLDGDAERIIERFASQTGLDGTDTGKAWIFDVDHAGHPGIHVTQTLDAIDPGWPQHVGFQDPA
jgi:hypothetical protein